MALLEWLEARQPEAPEALRVRIARLVQEHPEWEVQAREHALLLAGEALMRDVLSAPAKDRKSALDLLAADACVTYAFEAAADEPATLASLADRAVQRIALMAGRGAMA